ncbi:MAG: AarF/ABC1/UbiB kinase family protein [Solirubrobacterales bacterium]|nr:AarF/ABC1/UbiB kinase family protein [Solirubrobacterales bacterium]
MSARGRRRREIAKILIRHGWGFLLNSLGLEHLSPAGSRALGPDPATDTSAPAERLRLTLEELGPTFVKLGQLLSTRADLLPPDYRAELAKLQDDAPRMPGQAVAEVVALEIGGDLDTLFARFDLEPLAAASIGQVHAATLLDGTEVVVKVRRPRAVEEIEQDLEIVRDCAAIAARRSEPAASYDVVGLVDEFAHTVRTELDYLREGRNAARFAASFAGDPDVQIPSVFWEATTSRVITLERINGVKVTDVATLDAAGVDRHELAQLAIRVVAKMVFDDGFFHADPHPGNFFVQPGGGLGLIDFGMVGTLDDHLRGGLAKLVVAFVRQDAYRLADALLSLGASTAPVDRGGLRDDLAGLMSRYTGRGLGDIELATVINDVEELMRRHRLRVPRDLALLLRAFVIYEGMAAELDPDFRLVTEMTPYAYRHLATELSPAAIARRVEQFGADLAGLTVGLPGQLRRALDVLGTGGFEVHLRMKDMERAERVANRIAGSVLAAAVLDALAALAAGDRLPTLNRQTRKLPTILAIIGLLSAHAARKRRGSTSFPRRAMTQHRSISATRRR